MIIQHFSKFLENNISQTFKNFFQISKIFLMLCASCFESWQGQPDVSRGDMSFTKCDPQQQEIPSEHGRNTCGVFGLWVALSKSKIASRADFLIGI